MTQMKRTLVLAFVILTTWQARSQSNNNSTGWISCQITPGEVLIPVTINDHAATARLLNGSNSSIDKDFIDKNNIPSESSASGQPKTAALTLQVGNLTVNQVVNATVFAHQKRIIPYDLFLGEEIFKEFIVDVDFPNQRIAFHRPGSFIPPGGVTPLAFKPSGREGYRAAALSIEEGPSMLYWVFLGDPAPISVYENYFAGHAMLQGRAHSIRMGGGPRNPPEAIATVREVSFAGTTFSQVPGVFPDDSVTGDHPAEVAGHIGQGILSRCRVIFDYGDDQVYVIPGSKTVVKAPFAKDRSGLTVKQINDSYVVRYVCPGSPAMKAGFQVGDIIVQVNNQPLPAFIGAAWQLAAWNRVQWTDTGATYSIMLKDGTVRKLTTAEFF